MGKKNDGAAFEVRELETFLAAVAYERAYRSAEHADRVYALLDAITEVNWVAAADPKRSHFHARLNRLLSGYEWRVIVTPSAEGLRPVFQPPKGSRLTGDDGWEHGAVSQLLSMFQFSGVLARLSRCENCRQFLVGKKSTRKQYCDGGQCKQKAYESKPENRLKKRETMRRNYATARRLEEAAKQRVNFGKPKR